MGRKKKRQTTNEPYESHDRERESAECNNCGAAFYLSDSYQGVHPLCPACRKEFGE